MSVSVQSPPSRIRFQSFELNLTSCELFKNGQKIPLPPKALEVLRALVERPGELVTREELRARLWAADTFVEFDDGLNHTVKTLRQALGDSFDHPKFIETLPRHGYRFLEQVDQRHTPREVHPHGHWSITLTALVATLLAAVTIPLAFHISGWRMPWLMRSDNTPIRSLAVLPLSNLSGDPQQEYFADGMTDALITDLAKIGALKVISRTSVMQFKGAKKPLPDIAKDLGVDGILEGSVQHSGQHVRVTVQLVRGATDSHLWAESYERDAQDVLRL
jgi:TolB-like protein/DNA-binding winged helix-turn-helix (wHTH) protein